MACPFVTSDRYYKNTNDSYYLKAANKWLNFVLELFQNQLLLFFSYLTKRPVEWLTAKGMVILPQTKLGCKYRS